VLSVADLFLEFNVGALFAKEELILFEFNRSIDSTVSFIRLGENAGGVLPCGNLATISSTAQLLIDMFGPKYSLATHCTYLSRSRKTNSTPTKFGCPGVEIDALLLYGAGEGNGEFSELFRGGNTPLLEALFDDIRDRRCTLCDKRDLRLRSAGASPVVVEALPGTGFRFRGLLTVLLLLFPAKDGRK
jgi:hypothetical protein